jgi:CP family cyanate transporter-like MFS transporter
MKRVARGTHVERSTSISVTLDDLLAPVEPPGRRQRDAVPAPEGRGWRTAGPVIGLVLIGLNLRIGVASVGPVLTSIRDDLGLSATVASLLTTIPVIAFGAFAFLAPALIRRLGLHQLLGLAMAVLTGGIALRLQPSVASMFAGTVITGAAIAVACAAMPAVIKQDYPHRVAPLMSLYSTSLFLSACLADGLTVPLLSLVGGHWRSALALWCLPAAVAFLAWCPQFTRAPGAPARAPRAPGWRPARPPSLGALLSDPVALSVSVFMGVQSIGYYVTLTWLPTLLQDHGMDAHLAGWMLSFSAFPGIAAALVSPALARRVRPRWIPVAVAVACYGAAYAGLAVAPLRAPYLWMTLLGLGQGASISLALSYVAWRSPDARHTAHLSTMAQGIGYLLASLGPVTIGAVHAASRGWTVPLIVLAALLVPQLISGALASRERFVLVGREFAGRHPTRPERQLAPGADWSVWTPPAREERGRRTRARR